ncbi:MAG: EamA family transporter [Bacteroidales bacterium]|nr:EamA family transporter [Bacteroidales bacterium]
MLKLLLLSLSQSACLAAGQVFLKIAMKNAPKFSFTWPVIKDYLTNWNLLFSGLSMGAATLLWFYILKHVDFSIAYPLISFSYVFGMLAAVFIFHESVPPTRWIGLALIVSGAFLILK